MDAAALNTLELGNVIQNGQRRQLNGDLNFETLYNKSKFLKKINNPRRKKSKDRRGGNDRVNTRGNDKGGNAKDDKSGKNGEDPDQNGKDGKKKEKRKKGGDPSAIARGLVRPLMLLRKARASYAENFSTIVPGYMPETENTWLVSRL